jgi:hypothetical protein
VAVARAWGLVALAAAAPLAACQEAHVNLDQAGAKVLSDVPDAALQRAAQRRIFFGHQSVGYNLVEGLELLGKDRPAARLRLVESRSADALADPGLAHAAVGKNRDPSAKLRDFAAALEGGLGARVDVAMVKLCFIDFNRGADPDQLFAEYRATVGRLRVAFPRLRILHVTVPLTTVQSGPRALLKRVLGRPLWGAPENQLRERYNALLRAEYEGKAPFFDLARVEATLPGGAGRTPPALAPEWASDEGHLNPAGSRWAAAHLLRALAAVGD